MFAKIYKFGEFTLHPENRRFFDGETLVPVRERAFDILLLLVRKRGTIVEKDEPRAAIQSDSRTNLIKFASRIFIITAF